ncbi:MAG: 30S ribosomal protein S16 [Alphaproteobacteria bacterium]|nr:30S ribosomal protein S16 [Alphaproteobacteria bacterium]
MLVLRMTRHGAKKRPFYHIVAADSRFPRDGRYLEKVGTYNPMLLKEDPKRVVLTPERVKYWLEKGAQPSDRVARILHAVGLGPKVTYAESPKKSAPRAKAQERLREEAEAAKAAAEAAAEARAESATETPAEA